MENIFNKWRESLKKTRDVTFGKIATYFGATEINDESWDGLKNSSFKPMLVLKQHLI